MTKAIAVLFLVTGIACGEAAEPTYLTTGSPHRVTVLQPSGAYDLYVGKDIALGTKPGQPLPPGWYRLGNVSQARVDQALANPSRVATFRLEDPASEGLEIEIDLGASGRLKLAPADPCVSGVVQVAIISNTSIPTATFDVTHWTPSDPSTLKTRYSMNLLTYEEWPVATYDSSSARAGCK